MKSFIHRSRFESTTLQEFKKGVMILNQNSRIKEKGLTTKTKEQLQMERLKHEQNKRASEKRGLPKFDMEMAKKLLEGKFHEEDEDEMELTQ